MIKKYCENCKIRTTHHQFRNGQTQCLKCGLGDKKNPGLEKERLTKSYKKLFDMDGIKIRLLKEINKYPERPNNENSISNYCLNVINSNDKLNRFEKNSFSEFLSRWALEERLEQHKETKKILRKQIKEKLQCLCESVWDDEEEMMNFLFERR